MKEVLVSEQDPNERCNPYPGDNNYNKNLTFNFNFEEKLLNSNLQQESDLKESLVIFENVFLNFVP